MLLFSKDEWVEFKLGQPSRIAQHNVQNDNLGRGKKIMTGEKLINGLRYLVLSIAKLYKQYLM